MTLHIAVNDSYFLIHGKRRPRWGCTWEGFSHRSQAVSATYTILQQSNAHGHLFLSKGGLFGHLQCYCPCNDHPTKAGRARTLFYLECTSAAKAKLTQPHIHNRLFSERCRAGSWLLHTSAPRPDRRTQQASPAPSLARQPLYCFSPTSQWVSQQKSDNLNTSKQTAEQNLCPEAMLIRAGRLNRDRLAEDNSLSRATPLKKQKEPVDRRVVASRNPQKKPEGRKAEVTTQVRYKSIC